MLSRQLDTQQNDIQHNETQHNGTQNNRLIFVTLSVEDIHILTPSINIKCRNAECCIFLCLCSVSLCWVSFHYAACHCACLVNLFSEQPIKEKYFIVVQNMVQISWQKIYFLIVLKCLLLNQISTSRITIWEWVPYYIQKCTFLVYFCSQGNFIIDNRILQIRFMNSTPWEV